MNTEVHFLSTWPRRPKIRCRYSLKNCIEPWRDGGRHQIIFALQEQGCSQPKTFWVDPGKRAATSASHKFTRPCRLVRTQQPVKNPAWQTISIKPYNNQTCCPLIRGQHPSGRSPISNRRRIGPSFHNQSAPTSSFLMPLYKQHSSESLQIVSTPTLHPNDALLPWLTAMVDPSVLTKPLERLYDPRCRKSECICCCDDCCCWLFRAACACCNCCNCCGVKDWFCIWNKCCPPMLKFWPLPLLIWPVATFSRCTSSRNASFSAVRHTKPSQSKELHLFHLTFAPYKTTLGHTSSSL